MKRATFLLIVLTMLSATLTASERTQLNILFGKPAKPRFEVTPPKWDEKYGSMHVTLWEDGKVACVTHGIDDNIAGEHDWWIETGKKLDMKFTWFVIVYPCVFDYDGKPATNAPGLVKIDKFQRLFEEGHDVQGHGGSRINRMPEADYEKDLVFTKRMLEEHIPGNKVLVYAYPSGDGGGIKNEVAARHFIAARGTVGAPNLAARIRYEWTNDADWSKEKIDALLDPKSGTYRGWISSLVHKVGMGTTKDSKRAAFDAKFAELKYVADRRDQLWATVYRKAALYGQERDTHKLTPDKITPDTITFDLTDDMNDELFDYPLTVKITLNPSWDAMAVTQGGKPAEGRIILYEGRKFALVKAVPDRGQVVLSKTAPTAGAPAAIFPAGGRFKNRVDVTLQTITSGATMYYTTDGSEPTSASTLYDGPITFDEDATITLRAITLKDGLKPSPITSAKFEVWLDKTAPKVVGARAVGNKVVVFFNEEVEETSAGKSDCYAIHGATISKATLLADGRNVVLDVAGLKPSVFLKIADVKDTSGNVIPADTQCPVNIVAKPAEAGLVAYWSFDEPDGASAAINAVGDTPPGLIPLAGRAPGKVGNAITLTRDAKGVLAKANDFGIKETREFSVSLWCRYDKGWKGYIFGSKGLQPFVIRPHYHGAKFRSAFRDSNTRYLNGTLEAPKGEWFHYAISAGKTEFKTYVNGKIDVQRDVDPSKGGYLIEKVDYLLGGEFEGMLDELRLYNRALTEEEIKRLAIHP